MLIGYTNSPHIRTMDIWKRKLGLPSWVASEQKITHISLECDSTDITLREGLLPSAPLPDWWAIREFWTSHPHPQATCPRITRVSPTRKWEHFRDVKAERLNLSYTRAPLHHLNNTKKLQSGIVDFCSQVPLHYHSIVGESGPRHCI